MGTLNLISAQMLVRAAQEVRRGVVFSLNLETTLPDPPILGRGTLKHHRIELDDGGWDDYYDSFYPQASSQWDSLGHCRHPEVGFYQGYDSAAVTDSTTPALGIEQWSQRGIAGRFVLVDVAGHLARRGTPLDASKSFGIHPELLEEVLTAQESIIEPGDILLLNTGWTRWYRTLAPQARQRLADQGEDLATPGLDPGEATVRWLWNRKIAAIAADCPAVERMPFDKGSEDSFLHIRLIPKLGFALGELFDLEQLAADCETDGRYHGLFVAAPLNTPGGAGSPANALVLK
ncbi:cyclase family protein [Subtercola lobariae]|uniref:cyclase family protein n=1 Tax=Subtercola lobariae TaxID=1588641 RepID=UPI00166B193D|nr:cyclase family protein [Subtercola lobariae]